jgi:hypothetical protein
MNCIFAPFSSLFSPRRKKNNHHDMDEIVPSLGETISKHSKNSKNSKSIKKLNKNINNHNKIKEKVPKSPNNKSNKTETTTSQSQTPTQSQSATTKSTVSSNPSGVPFEIGGHSFDASDEVSLMTCPLRHTTQSFESPKNLIKMKANQQQMWLNSGERVIFNERGLLEVYEDGENDDDSDSDDDTKSNFTRISI